MNREIELILNSTHDAMIAVDKMGIVTLFNNAAAKLTEIDSIDAIGKNIKMVIESTRLPIILKTGESELNRKQPLKSNTIITNRMPVKDENGEIIGAIAVFREITEIQKLAEEITNLKEIQSTLEAIFNATQDAINVVDENGINVLINPAYTRLTGYTSKDVIGKDCATDLADGESVHLKVLKTKKAVNGVKLRVGPNKKEVVVEAAPILVNNKLIGSVAVIRDLTETNRLLGELDQAKQIIRHLEAKYTFEDIKGNHPAIVNAIEKAKLAALTPATIILRGESGTGKELFAHAIHNASNRKYSQFIRVNCASLSESILESELFGYEEGAFTGAIKGGKIGLFERANGGTIFLDEIAEVSMRMQSKLLRVLQEKELIRVGGNIAIPINVRVISATNVDLENAIKQNKFRMDLYYRLNVFPITIPPLRDHKEDIEEIVYHLINKFNQEFGRNVNAISDKALKSILDNEWRGNVRELENFIGRAIINMKTNNRIIDIEHMPKVMQNETMKTDIVEENFEVLIDKINGEKLSDVVDYAEKKYIRHILNDCSNNRELAARKLNISLRSLYYKIKKYDIK
ncbi:sigma 54-interacting transcriptional regulator [Helicovermis profundi]|uniref:Sigma-54-dependent Fis family transcriptional regulator n=1 Tax=Helicovermis profundi TaxID=3065157 RepID=A0AAU9E5T6_9FIRM|nr:sigma-54-dependent Fis family transcriptional regulator [Clostridia bacterium S502]